MRRDVVEEEQSVNINDAIFIQGKQNSSLLVVAELKRKKVMMETGRLLGLLICIPEQRRDDELKKMTSSSTVESRRDY